MEAARTDRKWTGKTDGTPWMHRALVGLIRVLGLRTIYVVAAVFVVPFYLLFRGKARRAIYRYFRQRQGFPPLKAACHTVRNHFRFAQVILDRAASYGGRHFEMVLERPELFYDLANGPQGFMMLGSHIGNHEIVGYSLPSPKPMNALAFGGEAGHIIRNRRTALAGSNVRLVEIKDDLSHLFILNNALADGEIVTVLSDRVSQNGKTLAVNLLGAPVRLPEGPFFLAAAREVPVISVFVLKETAHRYRVLLYPVDAGTPGRSRQERMETMAASYARSIEEALRRYPDQWFNYYDFWES